jgi:hypothetical protein
VAKSGLAEQGGLEPFEPITGYSECITVEAKPACRQAGEINKIVQKGALIGKLDFD